ncbi:hypothetical protein, partial [Mycobacteroides abscessus]
LDQTFDIQIILGKVRPFLRRLAEAHPQVLIIALIQVVLSSFCTHPLVIFGVCLAMNQLEVSTYVNS